MSGKYQLLLLDVNNCLVVWGTRVININYTHKFNACFICYHHNGDIDQVLSSINDSMTNTIYHSRGSRGVLFTLLETFSA